MSKDYPMVALGEVLRLAIDAVPVDASMSYPITGVYSFGRGLLTRAPLSGTETTYKILHRLHKDDFVLSQLKAWEGALASVPASFDGWFLSPQFPTFRVLPERLEIAYLDWYCKQSKVWEKLRGKARGMGARRDSVSPKQFLSLEIPLPPIEEQRSLVARIEELAAKIAEARGLRSKALEETKALLPSIVEQVLKTLRGSAEEVTVESIAKSVTDGDHQPPPKADSGIPFIFINHVAGGKINFSGCKWVPLEYFSRIAASRVPKPGDVLYTSVGSYGIPCLVETNEPFCFQRHIAIIKPDQSLILSKYLTWVLSSPDILDQATKAATGSAQLTVPLRGIRKLKFPLPPLPEQRRIVAYLDNLQTKLDALKQMQAETAAELNALLPSILDKAFKGEL